jgi:hypothetical protein
MILVRKVFILLIVISPVISVAQIAFEKIIPPYLIATKAGQASDGNYFVIAGVGVSTYLLKYNEAGKELDHKELNQVPVSMFVSNSEIVLLFNGFSADNSQKQFTFLRLNHNMDTISEWDFNISEYFQNCHIQKNSMGNYFLFYSRAIIQNGTYNDFRLFFLVINAGGQLIEEKQVPGNFSSEVAGVSMGEDDNFYLFGNEFEYSTTTTVYGRVLRISPQREILFDTIMTNVQLLNGFSLAEEVHAVGMEGDKLNVYRMRKTSELVEKIQIGTSFNFDYTTPEFVELDEKGLAIMGRSNGVELPKGFFILRTDQYYSLRETTSYYRGRPASRMNAFFKTKDNGFFAVGVIYPEMEIIANIPNAYLMKFDQELTTGYRPQFEISNVADGLQSDMPLYWLDYNNDGEQDFITINTYGLRLFENNGGGQTFHEVTGILPTTTNGNALSIGDYDNDGFQDVFVSIGYTYAGKNILLHNKGNGTFESVTNSGLTIETAQSRKAQWVDFNKDGYLDLFLIDLISINEIPKLFMNMGDGTFTRVFSEVIKSGNSWLDLNQDMYPDLIHIGVATQVVYINNHGKEMIEKPFSDYFEDGDISHFAGTLYEWSVLDYDDKQRPLRIMVIGTNSDYVYKLNEQGKYVSEAMPVDLVYDNDPHGFENLDINNDHFGDLFFNGPGSSFSNINGLLFNRADSEDSYTFIRGLHEAERAFDHFSWIDVNRDGFLDLIGSRGDHLELLKNVPVDNNWIVFNLKGVASSSLGSGAIVKIKVGSRWQSKEVATRAGFDGQLDNYIHFGLGHAQYVDSAMVYWPSGCYQMLKNLTANDFISVKENCSGDNPVLTWNKVICENEPVTVQITSDGSKFQWFSTSTQDFPLGESGKNLQLDTLTQDIVLFVANADSAILSRSMPVTIRVYPKPDFVINYDSINSFTYKFFTSSTNGIETYLWSSNGQVFSNLEDPSLELSQTGIYNICLAASNPGCIVEICSSIYLIITGLDEFLLSGYEAFPNPVSTNLTVRSKNQNDFDLSLHAIDGKTVFEGHQRGTYEISMKDYAPGLYTIVIKSKELLTEKRVVIKVVYR